MTRTQTIERTTEQKSVNQDYIIARSPVTNVKEFIRRLRATRYQRLEFEEACSLAVEVFDNKPDLQRAHRYIMRHFNMPADFVQARMLVHAQDVGYDDSPDLINSFDKYRDRSKPKT